jgi:predicted HAD superfamily Cof-like phosphohydrolase
MEEDNSFNLVKTMHEKFGIDNRSGACRLKDEERTFRIAALQEELDEFKESTTLIDDYDALLDLIVFAMGTIERMGLPFAAGFEQVMICNMTKELGPNNKRGGFKADLRKPEGFKGPEDHLSAIINKNKTEKVGVMDALLGRKANSHTSPKSVIRNIAKTKNEKLTRKQIDMLVKVCAAATHQINKKG